MYEGNDLEVTVPRNAPANDIPDLDACDKKIQRFVDSILNVYNPNVDDEMQVHGVIYKGWFINEIFGVSNKK